MKTCFNSLRQQDRILFYFSCAYKLYNNRHNCMCIDPVVRCNKENSTFLVWDGDRIEPASEDGSGQTPSLLTCPRCFLPCKKYTQHIWMIQHYASDRCYTPKMILSFCASEAWLCHVLLQCMYFFKGRVSAL